MLSRLYELKEEVEIFLQKQKQDKLSTSCDSSTYLCEAGFSALVILKTKQRNRLDVENDLRCALPSFNPRISDIVRKKQQHPSH
ncbi:hypothetical protein FHG87_019897 [Trinorchestia longiramus]|nr:hypothetical protein FHG87_019897 [Trinorchestia longiramus]